MKAVICAIAKNENNYILEWVDHYKKLGFTKIFLYDNNDIDGERFDDVIGKHIKSGFVEVINARGLVSYQTSAYTRCYREHFEEYDWIAYFDIDEFLILSEKFKNINEFLSQSCFDDFNCIKVHWKQFTDSGLMGVKDGDYSVKRFTEFRPITEAFTSTTTKSILRVNIKEDLKIDSPHGSWDKIIKCCNADGDEIPNKMFWDATWDSACLNHYRFKTIEEYVLNKVAKGWPTMYGDGGASKLDLKFFFRFNEYTKEKEDYANQLMLEIKNMRRKIFIRAWVEFTDMTMKKRNFGDELNFTMLSNMMPYKLLPFNANNKVISKMPNFLFIGSFIKAANINPKTVIWGTGIIRDSIDVGDTKPYKVCAVRGPLTRNMLIKKGWDVPEVYGDPAILASRIYNPTDVKKKYKIGIIPHYMTTISYSHKYEHLIDKDVKIIRMNQQYDDWREVIDQMLECEYIVSESLHGLILAESYGMPNLWVDMALEGRERSEFKFHDFFLSLGKDREKPFVITEDTSKEDLLEQLGKYERVFGLDIDALIESCPIDLYIGDVLHKGCLSEDELDKIERSGDGFTSVKMAPPNRKIIQSDIPELSGNFSNPVIVFTCCFNGETPTKYVIPGVEFYCFVPVHRDIDGWNTIVVDNFRRDPAWGERYIIFHPNRYLSGKRMIYIHPDYLLPKKIDLSFKESLALFNEKPIYPRDRLTRESDKLCVSKNDKFIIYNFENRETDKLLADVWSRFNRSEYIISLGLSLNRYSKYVYEIGIT